MNIERPREEQIYALRRLWREAFGDSDSFLDVFWRHAYSPDRCRCVAVNGEPAAALYWFDCLYEGSPIAYLYAVATAKAHRGQGLCRRLMEDTHRHLAVRGYAGAILVPGEESLFRFYERLGYRVCSGVRSFSCDAGDAACAIRGVGTAEYAALRRQFLPRGGVVQEGENLAFLADQAALYAGEDFVLAARREGETLVGIELLGDSASAPPAVRALGCRRGTFRTPGNEVPFAMYLPLDGGILPQPAYFGLAFD